jgi:dTDP-4-dehydrorhamnose reductase
VLSLVGEDEGRVVSCTTAELGRAARRPARSDLDNAALRLSGRPLLPDHRDAVERTVKELMDA